MRFVMNVGDDAHIVPKSHGTTRCVEWDGVTFSHSTGHGNIPTWARDDVGIVPYKETGGSIRSTGLTNGVDGGIIAAKKSI